MATDRQEHRWLNLQIPGTEDDDYAIITREDGYPLSNAFFNSDGNRREARSNRNGS